SRPRRRGDRMMGWMAPLRHLSAKLLHQGQQSIRTASTGRTPDCKRPLCCTPKDLLPGGGHPHMIRRREVITLLCGVAAAWTVAARAQQRDRMRFTGVLLLGTADDVQYQARVGAFLQGMQEAGWVIGRNLRIDTRWATTDADDIRRHATELAALAPDVILAYGASTVGALLQATRTVPLVFPGVVDPVGAGFVNSLARPGGNATGFLLFEYGLSGKWLELLKQIAPGVIRVAVLRDLATPSGPAQFGVIQTVAPSLRVEVSPINMRDIPELEQAVATFARASGGGLI